MMINDFTVHIVDDEEPVRKSLAFMLTMNGLGVRIHESATAFLALAANLRQAVLLTDLRMPDMSGVELIRSLVAGGISIPSIVITGHGDVPMAVDAMKAGAIDFIEKPFEEAVIVDAIRRASDRLNDAHSGNEKADEIKNRLGVLSERERQVFAQVVIGQPNKAIAFNLDISPRTVEVHRANVMTKMQARSLPELVRMSLAAGLADRENTRKA